MSSVKNRTKSSKKSTGSPALKGLKEELNSKHSPCLNLLAKSYGGRSNATDSKITELDSSSFTLSWDFVKDGKKNEDMIFTFRETLSTKAQVLKHISELVETSKTELKDLTKNTLLKAYANRRHLAYKSPHIINMMGVIAFLSMAYYLGTTKYPVSPFSLIRRIAPKYAFLAIFKYTLIIHGMEAILAFLVCKYVALMFPLEITDGDSLKWVISTFFFGVSSLLPLLRRTSRLTFGQTR